MWKIRKRYDCTIIKILMYNNKDIVIKNKNKNGAIK